MKVAVVLDVYYRGKDEYSEIHEHVNSRMWIELIFDHSTGVHQRRNQNCDHSE